MDKSTPFTHPPDGWVPDKCFKCAYKDEEIARLRKCERHEHDEACRLRAEITRLRRAWGSYQWESQQEIARLRDERERGYERIIEANEVAARYRAALERLGSMEAVWIPFVPDKSTKEWAELEARMDYANEVLNDD